MSSAGRPNLAQVPTLTEVIESLPPAAAPVQGSPAVMPIVTQGLPTCEPRDSWSPMATVIVPSRGSGHGIPAAALADLPVLDVVVAEPAVAPVLGAQQLHEINESHLAQRVLTDVQRQVDGMLEFRLKEAMSPILAKHSEALVRALREELSRTMRDVVARSVAQEVAKLRQR
jgi:hypothetical protein